MCRKTRFQRYDRTLALLPEAISATKSGDKSVFLAEVTDGTIELHQEDMPNWF